MTLFRTKGDGYIWDRPTTQGEMVQFIILFLQKKIRRFKFFGKSVPEISGSSLGVGLFSPKNLYLEISS